MRRRTMSCKDGYDVAGDNSLLKIIGGSNQSADESHLESIYMGLCD